MSKIKNTDYLCLTGMLRAKEAKMLTRDKLERVINEPGFAEAARALVDCGYADMSHMDTRTINQTLEAHRAAAIAEVSALAPDSVVVDLFRLKYEYHNAKALVKSAGKGDKLLSAAGRFAPEKLQAYYEDGEAFDLPACLTKAMDEAKITLARTGNPQLADDILDKAYFAELSESAAACRDEFIQGYVRRMIDATNLRIAVRLLKMSKQELLPGALIPGGTISVEKIIEFSDSRERLALLYDSTPFAAALNEEGTTAFERACDNAVNAYLAGAQRVSYGSAVVIGYLAAVENEVMAIRIILTGKLMGIDTKLLRERLRDTYV